MKHLKWMYIFVTGYFAVFFIVIYFGVRNGDLQSKQAEIIVAIAVCGGRLNESLNSIKSMLVFSKTPLYFIIFVDDERRPLLKQTLTRWRDITGNQFQFELHNISLPLNDYAYWLELFAKCSSQRLFFPTLLPHIDSLLYVDADSLFLGPVEELWAQFQQFNDSHVVALGIEDSNDNTAWYPSKAKHPYYGKYGVNSGVMLMNITRMRATRWVDLYPKLLRTWKGKIPWGDQDIINIILAYRSSAVLELDCRYNFRCDQCLYGPPCAGVVERGVFLLHGSRHSFFYNQQPLLEFPAVYRIISNHSFGSESPRTLLAKLQNYMSIEPETACGAPKQDFLRVPVGILTAMSQSESREE